MKRVLLLGLIALSTYMFSSNVFAAGNVINYTVNEQNYEGYYIDAGKNAPLVLLLHDWDGLTDYEIKRANMLQQLGYSVFAADLFGKGVRPTEVKDKRQHTGELYKDRTKMRDLMKGALMEAASLGSSMENTVAMGYCFGGAAVLELARSGENLKGFATFHGGLGTPEGQNYANVSGPILVMHGTADTAIPMSQFADLATKLETEKVAHEMVTYSGAPHAFTVYNSKRYHQEADEKSWDLFTNFLTKQTK